MLAFLISSTFISVQIAIAVMFPPSRKQDPMAPPDKGDQDDNR